MRTSCFKVRALQGVDVTDGELMEYISESSMMSKALAEYEGMHALRLTT